MKKHKPDWAKRVATQLTQISGGSVYVAGWVLRTKREVYRGDLNLCLSQLRATLASALRKAKAGVK